MTKATTNVARVAAGIAGFGLVAMSFAPLAGAQTTTTTTTTTTASVTFTRDLTIGSTGADVTALQTWLIAKGFSIPAGATGYFGTQTRAAVSAYQAANNITPTAGYFGPITRAAVMADGGTTVSTTEGCQPGFEFSATTGERCETTTDNGDNDNGDNNSNDGDLSGDEASLEDYNLLSEEGEGAEGESEVEVATAEFDVEDGDVRVERAELTLHATDSDNDQPWDYIDNVSVWADGEKLGDMDTSDRDAWDEEDADSDFSSGGSDEQYTVTLNDLDYVVDEGNTAELTFAFDINDSIDDDDITNQTFEVAVLDDGIRAVDAQGIQQYTGSDTEQVEFGFAGEENGDLTIRESDENPDAAVLKVEDDQTSDEMTVFAFEVRNSGDADSLITDLTIRVDTEATSSTSTLSDVIRTATLSVDGDDYRGDINDNGTIDFDDLDVQVDSDDTMTFTLMVEFASVGANGDNYEIPSDITFSVDSSDVDAEGADSGDELTGSDFTGDAESETHSLSQTGFDVEAVSTDANVVEATNTAGDNSYGTFTIKFDVTADEDEDVFVDNSAARASATAGVGYNILVNNTASSTMASTAVLTSSADMEDDAYRVDAGETETFTLNVTIDPAASNYYAVELSRVNYDEDATDADAGTPSGSLMIDTSDSDFQTEQIFIQG